jgi:hypothetical protein
MAGKVAIEMKPTNAETNSEKNNDLIGQAVHVFEKGIFFQNQICLIAGNVPLAHYLI